VVANRAGHAMTEFANAHPHARVLVVAGGVAANEAIRAALRATASAAGFRLVAPPPRLCTDNGAMIAWAGAERLALGLTDTLDAPARPRWPLDEFAAPKLGSGAKGTRA
jgi:N6-L-threonylcarbamoyladenine synthase